MTSRETRRWIIPNGWPHKGPPRKLMKKPASSVGCTRIRLDPFLMKNPIGGAVVCKVHMLRPRCSNTGENVHKCGNKWLFPRQAAKQPILRRSSDGQHAPRCRNFRPHAPKPLDEATTILMNGI
jgi:hypothetical protein